jgi:hypothetical protein
MNILIIAVLLIVMFAFIQGFLVFLVDIPQERFRATKGLISQPYFGWILLSYILVFAFALYGYYNFVISLINCIKIG